MAIGGYYRLKFRATNGVKTYWVKKPTRKGKILVFTRVSDDGDIEVKPNTKEIIVVRKESIIKLEPAVMSLKYGELVVRGSQTYNREGFY